MPAVKSDRYCRKNIEREWRHEVVMRILLEILHVAGRTRHHWQEKQCKKPDIEEHDSYEI